VLTNTNGGKEKDSHRTLEELKWLAEEVRDEEGGKVSRLLASVEGSNKLGNSLSLCSYEGIQDCLRKIGLGIAVGVPKELEERRKVGRDELGLQKGTERPSSRCREEGAEPRRLLTRIEGL